MEELIVNASTSGKLIYAFGILLIAVFIRIDLLKLLGEIRAWRSEKMEKMKAVLDSEISPEMRRVLHEKYEQLSFYRYFKIYADREMRHRLIKLHEANPSIATWHDLGRAYRYLHTVDGGLQVCIKWHHHVSRWLVTGVSGLLLLYAIVLMILGLMMQFDGHANSFLALCIVGLGIFALSLLVLSFNWPFESAKKIQPLLAATESVSNAIGLDAETVRPMACVVAPENVIVKKVK